MVIQKFLRVIAEVVISCEPFQLRRQGNAPDRVYASLSVIKPS